MRDFIYQSLDVLLSRLKGGEYHLDRSIPPNLILCIAVRRFIWLARGFLKCLVLQRRICLVYMAPAVRLRNASLIHFGKSVTIGVGVLIDGLSREGISFEDNVVVGPYSVIGASSPSNFGAGLRMRKNSAVDAYSFIGASGFVSIGENVIMGQHVSFHAENHNYARTDIPIKLQGTRSEGIVIEDDCWVGSNSLFLDGARVGRGCVVAAGSVVRGEIPAYSVVAGVPARILKSRLTPDQQRDSAREVAHVTKTG